MLAGGAGLALRRSTSAPATETELTQALVDAELGAARSAAPVMLAGVDPSAGWDARRAPGPVMVATQARPGFLAKA